MSIEIRKVSTKKELKTFMFMHKKHYKGHEYYIPELDMEIKYLFNKKKNPIFKEAEIEYFLAYSNGKPVGRISAQIINEHNKAWNDNIGWFGFWITPNDEEIAYALLNTAFNWVKDRGYDAMRGPGNFSYPDFGLLTNGFTLPHNLMLPYNYYYYKDLLDNYKSPDKKKFEVVENLLCYYYDVANSDIPARIKRINKKLMQRSNYKIRAINPKKFDEEANHIFEIFEEAWKENFGSIPLNNEMMSHVKTSLKMIYDPNMIIFAENEEGKIIGFQIVLPDVNEIIRDFNGKLLCPPWNLFKFIWRSKFKRTKWCRLWATGIIKEYRKKGIDAMLYERSISTGKKRGYKHCDISWQLESNYEINKAIEAVGGKLYKELKLYELPIKDGVKTSRPVHTAHTDKLVSRMIKN